MENLWVYLTLLAASLQVIRNSLQKKLKEDLDDVSITWSRFLFSLPVILCLLLVIFPKHQSEILHFDVKFVIFCLLASITQIIGTVLLVKLFSYRNFLVGISYMKTETLQTAIIGTLFFSEIVSLAGTIAILIGTTGLIFLSPFAQNKSSKIIRILFDKSAIIGLSCGFFYSLSALFIKKALITLKRPLQNPKIFLNI